MLCITLHCTLPPVIPGLTRYPVKNGFVLTVVMSNPLTAGAVDFPSPFIPLPKGEGNAPAASLPGGK